MHGRFPLIRNNRCLAISYYRRAHTKRANRATCSGCSCSAARSAAHDLPLTAVMPSLLVVIRHSAS